MYYRSRFKRAIVCGEVGCSRISLFNSIKNWQCSKKFFKYSHW